MHTIVGATGHVGSALAEALIRSGEPVTVVTHDAGKRTGWERRGATVAVADVHDVARLREVFRAGRRVFLLNPPADVAGDTDGAERESVRCLLEALDGSGAEQVVALSTMGVQPGDRLGDLNVLHELEQGLRAQPIPASVVRGAYYFTNWDLQLGAIRDGGVLTTMLPADLAIPMAAPHDIGRVAARLMTEPSGHRRTVAVEGPERCTARDVAAAFAAALGRDVRVDVVPRERWKTAFRAQGFSAPAAESYARMTATLVDGREFPPPDERGSTTLEDHVAALVGRSR